ncbi:MAG: hypothetical protein ACKV0T_27455 [Planctomycetales bacterium]
MPPFRDEHAPGSFRPADESAIVEKLLGSSASRGSETRWKVQATGGCWRVT